MQNINRFQRVSVFRFKMDALTLINSAFSESFLFLKK